MKDVVAFIKGLTIAVVAIFIALIVHIITGHNLGDDSSMPRPYFSVGAAVETPSGAVGKVVGATCWKSAHTCVYRVRMPDSTIESFPEATLNARLFLRNSVNHERQNDDKNSSNRLNPGGGAKPLGYALCVLAWFFIGSVTFNLVMLLRQADKPTWYDVLITPTFFIIGWWAMDHGLNLIWYGLWESPYDTGAMTWRAVGI